MPGSIIRRGKSSWRLKYEGGEHDANGKRRTRYVTVRGTKRDAQAELTRRLAEVDAGTAVDPSKVTVAEYLGTWLSAADGLSPKTAERYRQLAEQQINPHLGATPLQKLRPAQIEVWHARLLCSGGAGGRPLSSRTVGHAHRVLHAALARAARAEIVGRNVASVVKPPRVATTEIQILAPGEIVGVLASLEGNALQPIVAVALGTGMRRGELCGLRWGDVNWDAPSIRVQRSVEETAAGLRIKPPKSAKGRRTIILAASTVVALRAHRLDQAQMRLALGMGRPGPQDPVFSMPDGTVRSPDNLSRDWRRSVLALKMPKVMFHALRHTHASALIASGLDVLTISRRLGHGTPAFTLSVYGHLFANTDAAAARAIDAAMGGA